MWPRGRRGETTQGVGLQTAPENRAALVLSGNEETKLGKNITKEKSHFTCCWTVGGKTCRKSRSKEEIHY